MHRGSTIHSNHLLKKSLVVKFHHISPTPPRFSLKKKGDQKFVFTKKNILRICCNQKFPPSHFPHHFSGIPSRELVSCYRRATSKAPAPSLARGPSIPHDRKRRPKPTTSTCVALKAASAVQRFPPQGLNGTFVWRLRKGLQLLFQHLNIPIWIPEDLFLGSQIVEFQWKISMRWRLFLGNSHQKISYSIHLKRRNIYPKIPSH